MSAATGLSESTIGRIWREHGLKPHRVRSFKLSNDPEFVEKLQDIVGLYLNPPEHAIVLSCDEKSQIQALVDCLRWVWAEHVRFRPEETCPWNLDEVVAPEA